MASSQSVVIASDQSTLNVQDTKVTYGRSAASNSQSVVLASDQGTLTVQDTKVVYGQSNMASSQSVVIASDQSTLNVQDTRVVYGQSTSANSQSVVIASDQSTVVTNDVTSAYGSKFVAGSIIPQSGVVFTPGTAGSGTLSFATASASGSLGAAGFSVTNLISVINLTRGTPIFVAGSSQPNLGLASASGTTVTLQANTASMSASDTLSIVYAIPPGKNVSAASQSVVLASDQTAITMTGYDTTFSKQVVGTAKDSFRDQFAGRSNLDPSMWDTIQSSSFGDIMVVEGNCTGASWLRITKPGILINSNTGYSPVLGSNDTTIIQSKTAFNLPARILAGITMSQRIFGQEFALEIVGVNSNTLAASTGSNYNISYPLATGTCVKAATTGPLLFSGTHGLFVGDRVVIANCVDSRFNHMATVSSVSSPSNIVITSSLAANTYTVTGGSVYYIDPCGNAPNSSGLLLDQTIATNAYYVTRTGGGPFFASSNTFGTTFTSATIPANFANQAFTYAFQPSFIYENSISLDACTWTSQPVDSQAVLTASYKRTQALPDLTQKYKLRLRACTLPCVNQAVGRIVSAQKSGNTTATITTDQPHGLNANSYVTIYGIFDQTNFANLTTVTQVASIVSSTVFTIVFGASATTTSYGGAVFQGFTNTVPTAVQTGALQSINVNNGLMTVVGTTTFAANILIGMNVQIYGLQIGNLGSLTQAQSVGYEGIYQVAHVNTTTLTLVAPGEQNLLTTACGGVVVLCTDFRLHFVRVSDYAHTPVEIVSGLNKNDISYSVPCAINNTPNIGTVSTITTVTNPVTVQLSSGQIAAATTTVPDDVAVIAGANNVVTGGTRSYYNAAVVVDRPGTMVLEQGSDTFTFVETGRATMAALTSTPLRITAASRATTALTTYTTTTGHYLQAGQSVVISGLVPVSINVATTVVAVPSATTFTASNAYSTAVAAATIPLHPTTFAYRSNNIATYLVQKQWIITNVAKAGNTITITTSATHNFVVGDSVTVYTNVFACNGTGLITSAPTATTFSFVTVPFNSATVTASNTAGFAYLAHGLSNGIVVTITGITPTTFNQTTAILNTSNDGTFTIYSGGSNGSATTSGTIQSFGTVTAGNQVYAAKLQVPSIALNFRYRFVCDPVLAAVKRFDIMNSARASNTGQIGFAIAPTYNVGDTIVVSGTTGTVANGTYTVMAVDAVNFFVYVLSTGADTASAACNGVATSSMSRFYGVASTTNA